MDDWNYTVEMAAGKDTYWYFITRERDGVSESRTLSFMDVKMLYPTVMSFNDAFEAVYLHRKALI